MFKFFLQKSHIDYNNNIKTQKIVNDEDDDSMSSYPSSDSFEAVEDDEDDEDKIDSARSGDDISIVTDLNKVNLY